MVTVYNRETYLAGALRSVLIQDPGPEEMEIVVVDDCSPDVDVRRISDGVSQGRVAVYRRPTNGGLSTTWTDCVRLARGRWVHILHDDDTVLPGFYESLRAGIENRPEVGAAFTRHLFMDQDDHWLHLSPLERRTPGILEDWTEKIFIQQRIQCPSIVVRREAYERLGGFHPQLVFALDWDMWKRIAASYAVWYEPRPLACYRVHDGSETKRLAKSGQTIRDVIESIEYARHYLPSEQGAEIARRARERLAKDHLRAARSLADRGRLAASFSVVREAFHVSPTLRIGLTGMRTVSAATAQAALRPLKSAARVGFTALRSGVRRATPMS